MPHLRGFVGMVVQGTRWGLPWLCVLALSATLASAMNVAVSGDSAERRAPRSLWATWADAGASRTEGQDRDSACVYVNFACSGREVIQARSALPQVPDRPTAYIQGDCPETCEGCDTGGGRLLYVGLGSWIPAESKDALCSFSEP